MSRSRVKWNEDNIAEIEANKPVRQKITEPKTPYHPMIDDEECVDPSSPSRSGGFGDYFEDALNILATSSSLNDVGSSSKSGSHLSDWTSSDDDTEAMDQGASRSTGKIIMTSFSKSKSCVEMDPIWKTLLTMNPR
ncbi:protein phosphatase inhibitor 2-like isoform X5 [Salvia hispanica]|uniref:protein phosphatase inhibitor 2-like isoform X5 n=1 Tax=Salvia hispanica TaxID=49212 RepID=UPI002009A1FA|nr:protein phosphatase inhibitor 2-like isoform X5 [Salvia hispanica]